MTVLAAGNANPLVSPPPPSTKGITSTTLPAPEVIDGPNNAVYGNSPPVGQPFTLVIATTFPITLPGLTLTFTGPSGQTFIANPSDFFIGQDTLVLATQYPPNSYLEYTPSSPSLFNEAGPWTVTLTNPTNSGGTFPSTTYRLGIGGFLPPSAIQSAAVGSYTAQGVHFPNENGNTTLLTCAALNCVDSGAYSFSFWAAGFTTSANVGCSLFITDPSGISVPPPVHQNAPLLGTLTGPLIQLNWDNFSNTTPNPPTQYFNTNWTPTTGGKDLSWHHYLGAAFTNVRAGGKFGVLYIDDIFQPPQSQTDNGTGAFIQPVNGKPFYFGGDGTNLGAAAVSVADVWIAPGETLFAVDKKTGLSLPFIQSVDRRRFTSIDASGNLHPINPSTFPPAPIIFTGGASTFGANFGFGGSFSLTGPLNGVPGPGGVPI